MRADCKAVDMSGIGVGHSSEVMKFGIVGDVECRPGFTLGVLNHGADKRTKLSFGGFNLRDALVLQEANRLRREHVAFGDVQPVLFYVEQGRLVTAALSKRTRDKAFEFATG